MNDEIFVRAVEDAIASVSVVDRVTPVNRTTGRIVVERGMEPGARVRAVEAVSDQKELIRE